MTLSNPIQTPNIQNAASDQKRRNEPGRKKWWWRLPAWARLTLSLSSLLLGLVILSIPFAPWIIYHVVQPEPSAPYETKLSGTSYLPVIKDKDKPKKPVPSGYRLVIPKIGVDVEIVEGRDERALYRGIWRFPSSSTPEKGGNTVLTGHRFQYLAGPRTLYLLDQMQVGDAVIVYWQGKEYDYRVRERRVVNPDAVSILDNTSTPQLTIFTCTPVFSTKQRLVLFAEPILTT